MKLKIEKNDNLQYQVVVFKDPIYPILSKRIEFVHLNNSQSLYDIKRSTY